MRLTLGPLIVGQTPECGGVDVESQRMGITKAPF